MNAAEFPAAERIPPFVILKLRLKPLAVGHAFLFDELGLPFFKRDAEDNIADLLLAVFICSMEPAEAKRMMGTLRARLFFKLWAWACRKEDFAFARSRFFSYLAEHSASPKVKVEGNSRQAVAPWHIRLYASLRASFHMEHQEAYAMPLVTACALRAAFGEETGKIELVDRNTLEFVDIVKHLNSLPDEAARDKFMAEHNANALGRN